MTPPVLPESFLKAYMFGESAPTCSWQSVGEYETLFKDDVVDITGTDEDSVLPLLFMALASGKVLKFSGKNGNLFLLGDQGVIQ